RGALVGHLRRAAPRPVAARVARPHRASLDARGLRPPRARLHRQPLRPRSRAPPRLAMEILILLGLIVLNGVFAMSEVALLTSRRPRLEALAKQGDRMAAQAVRLASDPTRFLSTVQIGITAISLLNGIISDALFGARFAVWLQQAFELDPGTAGVLATGGIVIAVTYFSIVVGELVPKRL